MAGECGSTCPVEGGFYVYNPNVGGNAVLVAVFAALVPLVAFLGLRFKTPVYSATLAAGLLLSVAGFIGRILLKGNPDDEGLFFLSLLGTILGPLCTSGAIFLTLPHILSVYGDHISPFHPMLANVVLYGLTVVAVVVQIVGTAYVSYNLGGQGRDEGTDIVAGGLGVQLLALVVFSALHFWFILAVRTRVSTGLDAKHAAVYRSIRFKRFLFATQMASALLIIYSAYRIVEMESGVGGHLFQNQVTFMILNGAIPLLAAGLVTLQHPGAAFGSAWGPTSPLRVQKRRNVPAPLDPHRLPPGYRTHERYDPNIRSQKSPYSPYSPYSPHSQYSPRRARRSNPPELPEGSPGLPSNPKPTYKNKSPMPSPTGTAETAESIDARSSIPLQNRNEPVQRMVEKDNLW